MTPFDRLGIDARPGRRRIFARGHEIVPRGERNEGREVDAGLAEARNELFEPPPAVGERELTQILLAVGQEVIGAQVRGKFRHELVGDGFAIEPLLQHVERLHAAIAHDQELAVDRAGKPQRIDEVGEAFGDVLAGARIEPRDDRAVAPRRGGLHADAVPFPFGHELGRIERGKIGVLERVRQHRRAKRRRIGACRFFGAAFEPGKQLDVGRREPGPEQFDVVRVRRPERRDRGLGEPRRNADPQAAGDELDQRPAPGLVERVEPARELPRQLRLTERGEGVDDGGEGELFLILFFPSPNGAALFARPSQACGEGSGLRIGR